MFKFSVFFFFIILVTFSSGKIEAAGTPVIKTDTIHVTTMVCEQCEHRIHQGLLKLDGVKSVTADHEEGTIVVEYDSTTITLDAIEHQISMIGYATAHYAADTKGVQNLPACCKK